MNFYNHVLPVLSSRISPPWQFSMSHRTPLASNSPATNNDRVYCIHFKPARIQIISFKSTATLHISISDQSMLRLPMHSPLLQISSLCLNSTISSIPKTATIQIYSIQLMKPWSYTLYRSPAGAVLSKWQCCFSFYSSQVYSNAISLPESP